MSINMDRVNSEFEQGNFLSESEFNEIRGSVVSDHNILDARIGAWYCADSGDGDGYLKLEGYHFESNSDTIEHALDSLEMGVIDSHDHDFDCCRGHEEPEEYELSQICDTEYSSVIAWDASKVLLHTNGFEIVARPKFKTIKEWSADQWDRGNFISAHAAEMKGWIELNEGEIEAVIAIYSADSVCQYAFCVGMIDGADIGDILVAESAFDGFLFIEAE